MTSLDIPNLSKEEYILYKDKEKLTQLCEFLRNTKDITILESYKNTNIFHLQNSIIHNPVCPIQILKHFFFTVKFGGVKNIILQNKLIPYSILKEFYCHANFLISSNENSDHGNYLKSLIINHPNWHLNEFI